MKIVSHPFKSNKTPSNQTSHSKRKRTILGLAILAVVAAAIGLIAFFMSRSGPTSTANIVKKTPVTVGDYRYVNACQAIPENEYKQVYGYEITTSAQVHSTFAEGTRTKLPIIYSYCSSEFGNRPEKNDDGTTINYNVAAVSVTLEQYKDTASAQKTVSGLEDQKGQTITLDPNLFGNSNAPSTSIEAADIAVVNVGDTKVYNDQQHIGRFEFVYRNMNIMIDMNDEVTAALDSSDAVTPEYVLGVIQRSVPVIKKSIDNTQLSQTNLAIKNIGQRINGGTSAKTVIPCDYFTSADFKTIMNQEDDNTKIQTTYWTDPVGDAGKFKAGDNANNGRGFVECIRTGYVDQKYPDIFADKSKGGSTIGEDNAYRKIKSPTITETIDYYKDSNEAVTSAKFKASNKQKTYAGTVNEVNDLGNYAAFAKYQLLVNRSDPELVASEPYQYELYVAKGSYVVTISIRYSSLEENNAGLGSDAQYKKAAELLLSHLPN